jgi:hypothetical protein
LNGDIFYDQPLQVELVEKKGESLETLMEQKLKLERNSEEN